MIKKNTLILIVFLVVASVGLAYGVFRNKYGLFVDEGDRVCFGNECFGAEIAATDAEHKTGLMNRKSLDMDKGMLFIYSQSGLYPFWMKNTLIPLDMVWLDQERRVVYVYENAMPCGPDACIEIMPSSEARYVFEAKAGTAKRIGLKPGDQADFFLNADQ
jgi:uncharacterized membrane protein (UPF0127 family)